MAKKNNRSTVLTLAIVIAVVSAIGLLLSLSPSLTGYQVQDPDEGTARVQIDESLSIIFVAPFDLINWGAGSVDATSTAVLLTDGTAPTFSTGFTTVSEGFAVENDGNGPIDLEFYMSAGLDTWLGVGVSSGLPVGLRMSVDNCFDGVNPSRCGGETVTDLSVACDVGASLYTLGDFVDVAESQGTKIKFCDPMSEIITSNGIEINLELTIDSDIPPSGGSQDLNLIGFVTTGAWVVFFRKL